jgi:PAS domain S-box-containing protein
MSNITLILRVYVVIFAVEGLLLLVFAALPINLRLLFGQSPWTIILLDTVSLTLISVPLVYLWAIRPFVSARSEAEALQLAKIVTELTQFVDTANAPIFGIDTEGRVNEWNQRSEQITGFTKAEVMGRDLVANFITDDYKVSVGEVLAKALHGEETANYEFPLFTQSGDRVDVLLNSSTRRDPDGQIVGVVGVGQDITELNKVRAEQDNIAKELTQFVDTANAPIFGIDTEGRVNEWNQRSEQITGFTKAEVMGRDLVANFITDDYKVSVGEVLAKALHGEETANYEFPLFTQSGDRVDVLLNSSTRRDPDGQIVGVVGVGQDITELNKVRAEQEKERKESAAQIIQASKLATLGEMATSVAHELNQPLSIIRMAAENSRRKMSKENVAVEYLTDKLQRIEEQTARAAAIIDHMRMFGREATEDPALIDPRNVVTNALDLMGEQLRLAGIEVVTEFPEDSPCVLGHIIQMEQVIINLLTNARDAMSERGGAMKITLRVFVDQQHLHITSEDTGGGIAQNALSRIFEPFYTTKEMGKGTGLGLSVGYGIIRDMKGTITAENINDGARFTITLPLVS